MNCFNIRRIASDDLLSRRLRKARRNARRNKEASRRVSWKALILRFATLLCSSCSCLRSAGKSGPRTGDTPGSRKRVTFNVEKTVFNYENGTPHCNARWCICVRELSTICAHRMKYAIPEEEYSADERRIKEAWWRHRDESLEVEDVVVVAEGLETLLEDAEQCRKEQAWRKAEEDYNNLPDIGKYIINEVTKLSNQFSEAGELWTREIMPKL